MLCDDVVVCFCGDGSIRVGTVVVIIAASFAVFLIIVFFVIIVSFVVLIFVVSPITAKFVDWMCKKMTDS